MPALFSEGFFVREPAWHGLGVVLADYPGREEAMRLAGHDFDTEEVPVYVEFERGRLLRPEEPSSIPGYREAEGFKALVKKQLREPDERDHTHGKVMHIVRNSYAVIPNSVCWDIVDAIIGTSTTVRYETGVTLEEGAKCAVTFWLDEPGQVTGDDSPIYPYGFVSWAHDGTESVKCGRTSVRIVCANTLAAAELDARRGNRDYTFRHTRNAMGRIEDAKMQLAGVRDAHSAFMELAEEIAKITLTREQRELFISQFIPMPPEGVISEKVVENIDQARGKMRMLLDSSATVPDAHRYTGYGALMASTEYLDHLRGYRNANTYVGRTLLRPEPLKAKIIPLIKECAAA